MTHGENSLKEAIHSGRLIVGTFAALPAPEAVEIIGQTGFDFVVIDDEHGWMNPETQSSLVLAARSVGIGAIVRLRENSPTLAGRALDMGAHGILVPHVDSADEAKRAVHAAKFFPDGERGISYRTRSAGYCVPDHMAYTAAANAATCVGVLIESKHAVEHLDDILRVPGLDFVLIGHKDLSQSLGYPSQTQRPEVMEHITTILSKTRAAGLTLAVGVSQAEQAKPFVELGARMVLVSKDMGMLYAACRNSLVAARKLLPTA